MGALTQSLPAGLTHPYDAAKAKAETYRHGRTFTWTIGDAYVAIQNGRVANARTTVVYRDTHPGEDLVTGRVPVVDWVPAPHSNAWYRRGIMAEVADAWLRSQLAGIRN